MHNKLNIIIIALTVISCTIIGTAMSKVNARVDEALARLETEQEVEYTEIEPDIIKTVAHVDLSNNKDLKLMYMNTESDIAYYIFVGDRELARVGDTVTNINGDSITITYCDIYGFRVSNAEYFYPGMSGTGIMDKDNNIIGYVSESLNTGEVYCIWN